MITHTNSIHSLYKSHFKFKYYKRVQQYTILHKTEDNVITSPSHVDHLS